MKNCLKVFLIVFAVTFFAASDVKADQVIQAYDSYLIALKTINSLEELSPYIANHQMEELKNMTDEQKQFALSFFRQVHSNFKRNSIKSVVEGDEAKIVMDIIDVSTNRPTIGTVYMVKEEGRWKVDKEEYSFKE